jgi:hypothetical protein
MFPTNVSLVWMMQLCTMIRLCALTIPHYCITYRIGAHKAITGGKTKYERK